MEKIRFLNDRNVYDGEVYVKGNIVEIKFVNTLPSQNTLVNGFELLNENNGIVQGKYPAYTTIYRTYEENDRIVELSNDGSVYVEPVAKPIAKPLPDPEPYVPTEEEIAEQKRLEKLQEINLKISELKYQLSSSDYKIIKSYEYSLAGQECEYDMISIHESRQIIRDEINRLEEELQNLLGNGESL